MYAPRAIAVFAVLSFLAATSTARAVGGELAADAVDTLATDGVPYPPDPGVHPAATPPAPLRDGVLRLAWIDPLDTAGRCGPGAREEAVRMFKAMGITAQWRRAQPGESDHEGEIRVILLDRVIRKSSDTVVLGATPAQFEGRPFVWIHVPAVKEAMKLAGRTVTTLELRDQYRLATALGRVIVHELVHAVTPETPHSRGLMAPRLSARDLTADALPIEPEVALALRATLSDQAPFSGLASRRPAPADGGLLAAEHARQESQP